LLGSNTSLNIVTNNIIGLNKNGQDPMHNMANAGGWLLDDGTNNTTTPNQHN
jgi:hypothetical protein